MSSPTCRTQCSISLPRQLPHLQVSSCLPNSRVLTARTVVPDGTIFIPPSSLRTLSSTKSSPYKTLAAHPTTKATCSRILESNFRYQATPCTQPTEHPGFEFSGCVMEDKKHNIDLGHAYRQNRMATTALARQLYSFSVRAPIFGLIWADGRVRAHVDWWTIDDEHLVNDKFHFSTNVILICSGRLSNLLLIPPTHQIRTQIPQMTNNPLNPCLYSMSGTLRSQATLSHVSSSFEILMLGPCQFERN